jgi:hypothetical protein
LIRSPRHVHPSEKRVTRATVVKLLEPAVQKRKLAQLNSESVVPSTADIRETIGIALSLGS